jgi:hypothetical protein
MADAINRIVPTSVAVEPSGWKEKEGKKERRKEGNARSQASGKTAGDPTSPADANLDRTPDDKGKHLDISAFIND